MSRRQQRPVKAGFPLRSTATGVRCSNAMHFRFWPQAYRSRCLLSGCFRGKADIRQRLPIERSL